MCGPVLFVHDNVRVPFHLKPLNKRRLIGSLKGNWDRPTNVEYLRLCGFVRG